MPHKSTHAAPVPRAGVTPMPRGRAMVPSIASAMPPEKAGWPNASEVDERLGLLWRQRTAAAEQVLLAGARYDEAEARLPGWARLGPVFVDRDGKMVGEETSAWPAIEMNRAELAASAYPTILARPSPATIEREFHADLYRLKKGAAERRRSKALAALAARQRRQRAEERKVGLPGLDATSRAAWDRFFDIEAEISKLSPATPSVMAALTLMETAYECDPTERLDSPRDGVLTVGECLLRALRPLLRGPISADVAELLDDRAKPIGKMAFNQANNASRILPPVNAAAAAA